MKTFKKKQILITILTIWLFSLSLTPNIGSNVEKSSTNAISPIIYQDTEARTSEVQSYTDYDPYGVYILGPSYVQRYPSQTINDDVYYTPVDNTGIIEGTKFSTYYVYINNTLIQNDTFTGQSIIVNLNGYIPSVGISNITVRVWHIYLKTWFTKFTVLNITYQVNLQEYRENFKSTKGVNNWLSYNTTSPYGSPYNWEAYVGGSWKKSGSTSNQFFISIDDLGITNYIGNYSISIVVWDNGYMTSTNNTFIIEIVSPEQPYLENIRRRCAPAQVGEVQNLTFTFKVVDNTLIDRIEVFVPNRYYPVGIHKVKEQMDFVKMDISADFLMEYSNITEDHKNIGIYFVAIDKDGKISNLQQTELYIDNPLRQIQGLGGKIITESLQTRPTIISAVVNDTYTPEYGFRTTFIFDRKEKCNVTIGLLSGTGYHQGFNYHHNRIPNDYNKNNENQDTWRLFAQTYGNGKDFYNGIVFWVMAENSSAIISMKVKIEYPSIMEPDSELGDMPLSCLKYVPICENITSLDSNDNYQRDFGEWVVIPRENFRNVTKNTLEITLPGVGLYAFGKDALDYQEQYYNVPGYSLEIVIALIGVTAFTLIKRQKKA